jgi:hypothetical protein
MADQVTYELTLRGDSVLLPTGEPLSQEEAKILIFMLDRYLDKVLGRDREAAGAGVGECPGYESFLGWVTATCLKNVDKYAPQPLCESSATGAI